VFLIGLLLAQYTFTGYDASAHMTEETREADVAAPWGIVMSIAGWILLLGVTFAIQNYNAELTSPSGVPPPRRSSSMPVLGGGPMSAGTHCAHGGKGIHYQWASRGGMAERLIAAVLKTARGVRPSGVRIPLPPPDMPHDPTRGAQVVATSCVTGKWPAAGA
jgi:hypothetical protein